MRTFPLPNGSVVNVVDVKAVRVHKHFMSDKFYVAIHFRDGSTEDVVEHLSRPAADEQQSEIVALIRASWDEVEPYEYGFQSGQTAGHSQGWAAGHEAGHSEGYTNGRESGFADGVRYVLSDLSNRRELLMREEQYGGDLRPSRRRYLRAAISVLSDIIQYFTPESSRNSEP